MLALSAGPDARRLDSTAEWKGVQLSPQHGGVGVPAGLSADDLPLEPVLSTAVQTYLSLPPVRRSCRLARNTVQAFCRTHGAVELADDAALLASELVANAVEHAGGEVTLVVEAHDGGLTVRVSDDNARLPVGSDADAASLGERGRGLLVVDAIAGDWGTTRHSTGKSVWFRLP